MKKKNNWSQPVSILAVMALATTAIGIPASAAPEISQQPESVQAAPSLIGQCRAATKSTAVYQAASTTSSVVRTLATNERVTLASNGGGGFIAINAPVSGFVQTANLKLCAGPTPTPPPTTGKTCRRVVYPEGLKVRQGPSASTALLGGVAGGSQVYLTIDPPNAKADASGRIWVEIARPIAGWVANGVRGGTVSNLGPCP